MNSDLASLIVVTPAHRRPAVPPAARVLRDV